MTATEERQLRRALHGTLESVSPPPVPLEAIVRRGRGVRLRRAGAAAGTLALAGIVAVTGLALRGSQPSGVPPAAPAARGDRAPVLGGPDRRADRRDPGLLAGHGTQPALAGPGQAPG